MGTLRTVLLVILSISFLTFVAFFGRLPIFRNTPIGFLYRSIWIYIPKGLYRIDLAVSGGRLSSSLARTGNYLMNDQHPLVLIFFLGLLSAASGIFIPAIWGDLATIHHFCIPVLLPLPYLFTYLCTASKTQIITTANHGECMTHYPFDHILFHPGQVCRTCEFEKPARSKHCSICKACVARSDHHCIWVNICLGRGNYKHFLYLLFSTTVVLLYGSYLAYLNLAPQVREHFERYPAYHKIHPPSWALNLPALFISFITWMLKVGDALGTALLIGRIPTAGVGMLALLTWPLPLGLLAYHVYLIWAGMTTNESNKWADWREDMADGVVFMAPIKPGADKTDASRFSSWPVRGKQVVLRTNDGQTPRSLPQVVEEVVEEGTEWDRCWRLAEVENLYDLGFWGNLTESLTN